MSLRFRDPYYYLLTACFGLLMLAWGAVLPAFESVDEQNHFRYMHFLRWNDALPRQDLDPSDVPGQGHQPPAYYALGALALRLAAQGPVFVEPLRREDLRFDVQPRYFRAELPPALTLAVHRLRTWQGLLLILPALWFLCLVLDRRAPGPAGRLAGTLLALNPAFAALAGGLNNDWGAFAFGTLGLGAAWLAPRGRRPALWAGAGLMLGLAALSKPSAVALLAAPLVLLGASEEPAARGNAAWLAAAWLAVFAWWPARNWLSYHSLTGLNVWAADCPHCPANPPFSVGWLAWWLRHAADSYWSLFGWVSWRTTPWFSAGALLACAAAVPAHLRRPGRGTAASGAALAVLLGLLLALAARPGPALLPPSGRYFYPLLLPMALFLGKGWESALQRLPRLSGLLPYGLLAGLGGLQVHLLARALELYR